MKKRDFQDILTYLYAAFALCMALWSYVNTLAPTVSFFDSGELISAAYTFGVAHPPGYPLYVLLGWGFSKLPIGTSVAYRLNVMSAVFAALAVFTVYWITYVLITWPGGERRILSPDDKSRPEPAHMLPPLVSMAAAFCFAFSLTHWRHAVIAEVYSLNAFLCGLVVLLLLVWSRANSFDNGRRPDGPGRRTTTADWLLYLVAWLFGLGTGNHQTIILFAVPASFLVLCVAPRILLRPKALLLILCSLLLGLSIYSLLPIRAAQNSPINWGNPVSVKQFIWMIRREGYQHVARGNALSIMWSELRGQTAEENTRSPKPQSAVEASGKAVTEPERPRSGIARLRHSVTHSLLFQQIKSCDPLLQFGPFGVILGLAGVIYGLAVCRLPTLSVLLAIGVFVGVVVLISDPPKDNIFLVQEFHTPAYLLMAVLIGLGAMALSRAVLSVAIEYRVVQYIGILLLAGFLLVIPGSRMVENLPTVDRRRNYVAYDYANNILRSLQPNAILFTWGDSGAFPLWYLQTVEGIRPDVALIHAPHLSAEWFVESLASDLFFTDKPFQRHGADLVPLLHEIVEKNISSRPIYFDYSSTFSIRPPYPLLPHGVAYKVAAPGDRLDLTVWERYQLRGILDDTHIALDPDIERTFIMYGSARMELGNYYLELGDLEEASREFNMAVLIAPELGEGIVQSLKFRNKLAEEQPVDLPSRNFPAQ
ncbi:MAG: DUF2723 domain-containing protein [bacterium]|nr:DUF2723 domain-containing protein [bacterium]